MEFNATECEPLRGIDPGTDEVKVSEQYLYSKEVYTDDSALEFYIFLYFLHVLSLLWRFFVWFVGRTVEF